MTFMSATPSGPSVPPLSLDAYGHFTVDLTNELHVSTLGRAHEAVAHDPWYTLNETHLCASAGHTSPIQVADLLDVCSQITLLDRICPRPRKIRRAQFGVWRGWSRHFTVTLGVREPDRWNTEAIRRGLERLLQWMTEDEWNISFRYSVRRNIVTVRQAGLLTPSPNAQVVLFSGGLDSLAGTVGLLEASKRDVVLVGVTHDRLQSVVLKLMGELQKHYGLERVHLGYIPFELTHMPRRDEYTQRTRAFRFLACGVAQAIACGLSDIVICENGVGSINLPYNWRQLGAQHTRATHPTTLVAMTALLHALDLDNLRCVAPYQFQTKAEICRHLTATRLEHLVTKTVSCDSFPLREVAPENGEELHCGECTSCLLRRQALFAADLASCESQGKYVYDVCLPPDLLHQERIFPLKMMLDQVTTIEEIKHADGSMTAFSQEFPELRIAARAIAQDPQVFGLAAPSLQTSSSSSWTASAFVGLCDLLGRYAEEWRAVPYRVEAA